MIRLDGFGGRPIKIDNCCAQAREQPVEFGGFKIFYCQDTPVMTPESVFSSLEPSTAFITSSKHQPLAWRGAREPSCQASSHTYVDDWQAPPVGSW